MNAERLLGGRQSHHRQDDRYLEIVVNARLGNTEGGGGGEGGGYEQQESRISTFWVRTSI